MASLNKEKNEAMPDQETITKTILKRARERGPSETTCPSEIARELFPADWRKHMGEISMLPLYCTKAAKCC